MVKKNRIHRERGQNGGPQTIVGEQLEDMAQLDPEGKLWRRVA